MRTRHCLFAAAVALLAAGQANGVEKNADRPAAAGSPLRMSIDKSKVDLPQHRLEVTLSHQVPKIAIKVTGESGEVLADQEEDVSGHPAGAPIVVTWNPSRDEAVMHIDLHATDARGSSFDVTLTPYSVSIPHDDVTFRTDSAEIDATEIPKLEAAHKFLIERLAAAHGKGLPQGIGLYIVGGTDLVGSAAHNLKLSRDRARSIAQWFRRKGVPIPIAYDGVGMMHVQNTSGPQEDQRINRRVDYFLSAGEPSIKVPGFHPMWKRLD